MNEDEMCTHLIKFVVYDYRAKNDVFNLSVYLRCRRAAHHEGSHRHPARKWKDDWSSGVILDA